MKILRWPLALFMVAALIWGASAPIALAAPLRARADPLEPARAALRTLQFSRALELLKGTAATGNEDAQYLLGIMYLNGVGTPVDPAAARAQLQSAAEQGQGAAAYVLASELAHDPAAAGTARHWLERSAQLGYARAVDTLKSGGALLPRENLGASDPALVPAWVIACVRRNDAVELARLGPTRITLQDAFGRGPLHYAVQSGAIDAATMLLQLGADVRAMDSGGTTALMLAAERPDRTMLDLLLQHGADVHSTDIEHRTALFYAARANQGSMIDALRQAGAQMDARDLREYSALDEALAVDADGAAAALRSVGLQAHVTRAAPATAGKFDATHPGELYSGWSPLALALARNDTPAVRQLLDSGTAATQRLPHGEPLLQIAIDARALESLPLLLHHGANAAEAGAGGHSSLWLSASRGDLAVVRALLAAGVAPDTRFGSESTPLLAAVRAAHADVVQTLLDAGANPESADSRGLRPLMVACATRQMPVIQSLLARHVRIDAQDAQHRTALWYSAAQGSAAGLQALIEAGAGTNVTDTDGLTLLHAAAGQTDAEVIALLLSGTANLNARTMSGDTPLLIAAAAGNADVVRALLSRHPDTDLADKAGDTALIAAARGGFAQICRLLLATHPNAGLRNLAGASAAEVAKGRGFTEIAHDLATQSL